jgi:hypothetical protein
MISLFSAATSIRSHFHASTTSRRYSVPSQVYAQGHLLRLYFDLSLYARVMHLVADPRTCTRFSLEVFRLLVIFSCSNRHLPLQAM